MEKAISDHHCEVCDQNLTDEWAHHLQMKLDDLKSSHPALTEDERTSLDLMQKKISALRGVKLNVDVRSIQATSDSLNRIEIQISNLAQELSDIEKQIKVDIKSGEVDIESTKVDIRNKLLSFSDTISEKTINHTVEIFSKCGKENCFGRTIVEEITGLKPSRASKLIKLLVDSEVIVPVTGHGKGKYRFQ